MIIYQGFVQIHRPNRLALFSDISIQTLCVAMHAGELQQHETKYRITVNKRSRPFVSKQVSWEEKSLNTDEDRRECKSDASVDSVTNVFSHQGHKNMDAPFSHV